MLNCMKKLLMLLVIILISGHAIAQKGLFAELSASGGISIITQQNTWGNDMEYKYDLAPAYSGNAHLGYNFSNWLGVSIGYTKRKAQQYYADEQEGRLWERKIYLSYNSVPVQVYLSTNSGLVNVFVSTGVELAFLENATQNWKYNDAQYHKISQNPFTNEEYDVAESVVTNRYEEYNFIINLSWGARVKAYNNLFIIIALRMDYGLNDINRPEWQLPDKSGLYKTSHLVQGGIQFGVRYSFKNNVQLNK